MVASLRGRVSRLERFLAPSLAHQCRACRFRHVQPLTMDLARRIIGPVSGMAMGLLRAVAESPAPKLCLCDPCCGDPGSGRRRGCRTERPRTQMRRECCNLTIAVVFPRGG